MGIAVAALSFPATQTFIAKKVVAYLNEDFGINIDIQRIHIKFNGKVDIKGTLVRDHKQDTLIWAKELSTSILDIKQLIDGNLYFGKIEANELFLDMKTHKGDTLSNLDVFVNKFDSGKPSSGKFVMKTAKINLNNSRCYISDENNTDPNLLQLDKLNAEVGNAERSEERRVGKECRSRWSPYH